MCVVEIYSWFGRFGNNINQIGQCLHFAFIKNNAKYIEFPKHDLLTTTRIINPHASCKCDKRLYLKCLKTNRLNLFFYNDSHPLTVSEHKECIQNFAKQYIKHSITKSPSIIYDVVIHVRSGDIRDRTSGNYKLPSREYFDKVLLEEMHPQKTIMVVYEDDMNQTYQHIKNKYPNLLFQSDSIENDLRSMINCKTLVVSVGTFSLAAIKLSTTIQNIYIPSQYTNDFDVDWRNIDANIISITA